jgi:hypothetical protein
VHHGAIDAVGDLGLNLRAAYTPARWSSSATNGSNRGPHRRPDRGGGRLGEVLVASIRDLAAGSGMGFEDRGSAELKGVPGEWQLHAARLSHRVRVG